MKIIAMFAAGALATGTLFAAAPADAQRYGWDGPRGHHDWHGPRGDRGWHGRRGWDDRRGWDGPRRGYGGYRGGYRDSGYGYRGPRLWPVARRVPDRAWLLRPGSSLLSSIIRNRNDSRSV